MNKYEGLLIENKKFRKRIKNLNKFSFINDQCFRQEIPLKIKQNFPREEIIEK